MAVAAAAFRYSLYPITPTFTTCDASWDTSNSNICDRQVFHADGSVVTRDAPARVNETLYALFYGLGRTDPLVKTGQPSPEGAVLRIRFRMRRE